MDNKAIGQQLADALISRDKAEKKQARESLRDAPPSITDAAAKRLAALLRKGGREADAVCQAIEHPKAPRFGGRSWHRILKALVKHQQRGSAAAQATTRFISSGPDPHYAAKKEQEKPPLSEKLVLRILSVGKRIWVWVVLSMGGLLIAAFASMSAQPAAYGWTVFAILVVACVLIDSLLRRCPSCNKFLAGQMLSIIQSGSYERSVTRQTSSGPRYGSETVNTHVRRWRCVSCKHHWTR
ncbi:MAG TPA: hypothetical protein ENJ18_10690 [Nannocystis exedens]|nr:hypothetical protein [Nannocystis exedens]